MDYLNNTIEKITEFLKSETKTETIIGKEFKLGEFSCVPVMGLALVAVVAMAKGIRPKNQQPWAKAAVPVG